MTCMTPSLQPDFPALRSQLAPMKAARQRLARTSSLHDLESATSAFLHVARGKNEVTGKMRSEK